MQQAPRSSRSQCQKLGQPLCCECTRWREVLLGLAKLCGLLPQRFTPCLPSTHSPLAPATGEEENGSIGFREAVRANLPWFEGTRLVVISNTLWVGEQVPCLTYGMRGMISLSVEVRGEWRCGAVHCSRMAAVGHEEQKWGEPHAKAALLRRATGQGAGTRLAVHMEQYGQQERSGMLWPDLHPCAFLVLGSPHDPPGHMPALRP